MFSIFESIQISEYVFLLLKQYTLYWTKCFGSVEDLICKRGIITRRPHQSGGGLWHVPVIKLKVFIQEKKKKVKSSKLKYSDYYNSKS